MKLVGRTVEGDGEQTENRSESGGLSISRLPDDIVELIMENLCLADRIRFGAVCKDLFSASIQFHEFQQLPWIMNFAFTSYESACVLFEPFCSDPYIMENKMIKNDDSDWEHGSMVHVHACRSGWVLLSRRRHVNCLGESIISYYVFDVMAGKIIELPDLTVQNHPFDLGTFSSVPTSSDCVFLVVTEDFFGNEIRICTYSVGDEDKSWKDHTFTCPGASNYCVDRMVYMEGDGSFYFFSMDGFLSSFNMSSQEWKPVTRIACPEPDWWIRESSQYWPASTRPYFLEYDGSLIIAFHEWTKKEVAECEIYRFDLTEKVWIKMESLEGGALFLGESRICLGLPSSGAGARYNKTKLIANRVYCFCEKRPTFITYGPVSQCPSQEERLMDYYDTWAWDDSYEVYDQDDRIWILPPLLAS